MKKILFVSLLTLLTNACKVENPNVTEDVFLDSFGSMNAWLRGTERQFATTLNAVIEFTELASDNYFNNRTLSSKVFDIPTILDTDPDVNTIQSRIHTLRAQAEYGLSVVATRDARTTDAQRAELHFYKGLAHLLAGELFVALPAERLGRPLPPGEHLNAAIAEFEQAIQLNGTAANANSVGYRLAIARAYRGLGNKAEAVGFARQALTAGAGYLRTSRYDAVNSLRNEFQFYIFDSGNDEFQPLPRLDFLDPKYFSTSNTDTKPVAFLKAEEAHLIIAEQQLADNELGNARQTMQNLLILVGTRARTSFSDAGEDRGKIGGNIRLYPDSAAYRVAASADDPLRSGLVLNRKSGPVNVSTVSGTSVTAARIEEAAGADQLLELLYLLRQEVFIAEGRRIHDLGIRFPVSAIERNGNPLVESDATQAQIPSFIPLNFGLDNFTLDRINRTVVIQFNMNRILVQNKTSPFVLPFH
ncbi:MAG: hypothetical protein H7Z75_17620 [Ferruginibacter sp.]|nr:hypothetical protein [Cytophagales bacterium]